MPVNNAVELTFRGPKSGFTTVCYWATAKQACKLQTKADGLNPHALSQGGDRELFKVVERPILSSQNATISKVCSQLIL